MKKTFNELKNKNKEELQKNLVELQKEMAHMKLNSVSNPPKNSNHLSEKKIKYAAMKSLIKNEELKIKNLQK